MQPCRCMTTEPREPGEPVEGLCGGPSGTLSGSLTSASLRSVVFGPELVSLDPEEQFTVLSLSAGRPKRPHARRALCLLLGPDFFTDVITIETADHARLQLQLAYNW